ncbi:hypothetical protein [Spirosoma montaniterrae]|nr:hypothetical protein [Spirosoma montaniterrae]
MFTSLRSLLAVTALCLLSLSGCKRDEVDPTKGFSNNIQNIISEDDINKLRSRGMLINEGSQPPNIEGVFISAPHTLVSPYDGDSYKVGDTFTDLVLRFSAQNNADQSAKVDLKTGTSTTGSGIGGFISGNGNKFTFFAEIDLKSGSATAKQVRIFSGEVTADGIKDFYTTLLMKSKTDPNDELIPVGAARVIKDGNSLASKRSTFRKAADEVAKPDESVR